MRGQIFTLDAVLALALLSVALYAVSYTTFQSSNIISQDLTLRRWDNQWNYAVQKLLLGNGEWACKISGVRVPGCVLSKNYSSKKDEFFTMDLNCYIEGDAEIANLMGCTDPPTNPLLELSRNFEACVGSPSNCTVKTLRLTLWKGQ